MMPPVHELRDRACIHCHAPLERLEASGTLDGHCPGRVQEMGVVVLERALESATGVSVYDRPDLYPGPAPAVGRECSPRAHAIIRRTLFAFRAWTFRAGYQDDGSGGTVELGTCRACGSTLAFPRGREEVTALSCRRCGSALERCRCAGKAVRS